MKIPLNRIVTFLGPVISVVAGGIATYLNVKLNILAIPGLGLNGDQFEVQVAGALTWLLTSGLLHLGQWSWLKGHHIELTYANSYYTVAPDEDAPEPINSDPADVVSIA